MTQLRSALLVAAALAAAGTLTAPAAHAKILTGWDMNLQNVTPSLGPPATGCAGCTQIPNVKLLNLGSGNTVVTQNISGGSIINQTFSETGLLGLVGGQYASGPVASFTLPNSGSTSYIPTGDVLYFTANNLTGTVVPNPNPLAPPGSGSLQFDGGTDAISLYLAPNSTIDPTNPQLPTGSTLIANFNMKPVTTGSLFTVFSNGVPSGSIGITLSIDTATSPLSGPLFTLNGNSLDNIALELANIQPALNGTVGTNPVVNATGTQETIYLTDQGQLQLEVPEPPTLALFGSALIGLVIFTERRRRKQKAIS